MHIEPPRRIVLKVGSRLLTGGTDRLQRPAMEMLVDAITRHRPTDTVLVTSGAVAAGYAVLGLARPPSDLPRRQAAAAVGQARLMQCYSELFHERGTRVGQVLLTHDVLTDRARFLNTRNTFASLAAAGVVPIVNENDTVSVAELKIGDNDNLAAYTAALVDADLLVLLTDVQGVYDSDPIRNPDARLIRRAESPAALEPFCFRKRAEESVGGMVTKLQAAGKAARYGIPTVIACGTDPAALDALYRGDPVGTRIDASPSPLPPRKHWVASHGRPAGSVVVDEGAARALRTGVKNLLPSGVRAVEGRFDRGDVVTIRTEEGGELARGIARYGHDELQLVKGRHSREVPALLGGALREEVVQVQDLVLMERVS